MKRKPHVWVVERKGKIHWTPLYASVRRSTALRAQHMYPSTDGYCCRVTKYVRAKP